MTNKQIILFITSWHARFPNADLPANLIDYLVKGDFSEYIRKFKDIYPERCDLIRTVVDVSKEFENNNPTPPVYKEGDLWKTLYAKSDFTNGEISQQLNP